MPAANNLRNKIPRHTLNYRSQYREKIIPASFSGRKALWLLFGFCLTGSLTPLLFLHNPQPVEWLTIPTVLLYATLMEYLGHRYPMHRRLKPLTKMFESHTLQHHRFMTNDAMGIDNLNDIHALLMSPQTLFFFLGLIALPHAVAVYFLISANVGLLFIATAFFYYFNYEILHTVYHFDESHWVLKPRLIRFLRQHHLHHHDLKLMNGFNFNVSYPIWDAVFGTFHRQARPTQPATPISSKTC